MNCCCCCCSLVPSRLDSTHSPLHFNERRVFPFGRIFAIECQLTAFAHSTVCSTIVYCTVLSPRGAAGRPGGRAVLMRIFRSSNSIAGSGSKMCDMCRLLRAVERTTRLFSTCAIQYSTVQDTLLRVRHEARPHASRPPPYIIYALLSTEHSSQLIGRRESQRDVSRHLPVGLPSRNYSSHSHKSPAPLLEDIQLAAVVFG